MLKGSRRSNLEISHEKSSRKNLRRFVSGNNNICRDSAGDIGSAVAELGPRHAARTGRTREGHGGIREARWARRLFLGLAYGQHV
jgi:hypothetical protein